MSDPKEETETPAPAKVVLPNSNLVQVPAEAVDELLERLKDTGLTSLQSILQAADNGQISREVRDALLADLVDGAFDAAKPFLDVVITLPEPGEALSDIAISQGLDALSPLVADALGNVGETLHELFDRDADRLQRRIAKWAAKIEGAQNSRQRRRREKQHDRLVKLLIRHFPDVATADGWRLDLEGNVIRMQRDLSAGSGIPK